MAEQDLLYEKRGNVAWLTLNRPKAMNSLNLGIVSRMEEVLPEVAADDEVRVVVLTGAGPAFCAGADLKEVLAGQDLPPGEPDMLDRMTDGVMNPLRDGGWGFAAESTAATLFMILSSSPAMIPSVPPTKADRRRSSLSKARRSSRQPEQESRWRSRDSFSGPERPCRDSVRRRSSKYRQLSVMTDHLPANFPPPGAFAAVR